jgi:hypothetical protein
MKTIGKIEALESVEVRKGSFPDKKTGEIKNYNFLVFFGLDLDKKSVVLVKMHNPIITKVQRGDVFQFQGDTEFFSQEKLISKDIDCLIFNFGTDDVKFDKVKA